MHQVMQRSPVGPRQEVATTEYEDGARFPRLCLLRLDHARVPSPWPWVFVLMHKDLSVRLRASHCGDVQALPGEVDEIECPDVAEQTSRGGVNVRAAIVYPERLSCDTPSSQQRWWLAALPPLQRVAHGSLRLRVELRAACVRHLSWTSVRTPLQIEYPLPP